MRSAVTTEPQAKRFGCALRRSSMSDRVTSNQGTHCDHGEVNRSQGKGELQLSTCVNFLESGRAPHQPRKRAELWPNMLAQKRQRLCAWPVCLRCDHGSSIYSLHHTGLPQSTPVPATPRRGAGFLETRASLWVGQVYFKKSIHTASPHCYRDSSWQPTSCVHSRFTQDSTGRHGPFALAFAFPPAHSGVAAVSFCRLPFFCGRPPCFLSHALVQLVTPLLPWGSFWEIHPTTRGRLNVWPQFAGSGPFSRQGRGRCISRLAGCQESGSFSADLS